MEEEIEEQIILLSQCQNKSDQKRLESRIQQLMIGLRPNNSLQSRFRNAVIQSNAKINSIFMEQKDQLLRNRTALKQRSATSSSTLNTSKKITQDLRYALEMTENQVSQSHAVIQTLHQSTKTLFKTEGKYDEIKDSLQTSKKITLRMSNKDKMDRYVLYCGVVIFLITILYIIWKRLWIPFL